MDSELFRRRVRSSGLSLREVGDFLGIHPHELRAYGALNAQPVRVVLELCRRLDLHPADLVDALTALTALARCALPLVAEELATALAWPVDRMAAALGHAADHPALGGPMALRRLPGESWTVTARLDLLSAGQERNVADAVSAQALMTAGEANALLAAYALRLDPRLRQLAG